MRLNGRKDLLRWLEWWIEMQEMLVMENDVEEKGVRGGRTR